MMDGAGNVVPVGLQGGSSGSRAYRLLEMLGGERGSKRTRESGGEASSERYVVQKDPRMLAIQQASINRWQQEYLEKQAEGRSGEDQKERIGTGPRKTIRILDYPLQFKSSHSTQNARKTNTQRLIESGQVDLALARARHHAFRSRPSMARDPRLMNVSNDYLSTQFGLTRQARNSYEMQTSKSSGRRLDAVSM